MSTTFGSTQIFSKSGMLPLGYATRFFKKVTFNDVRNVRFKMNFNDQEKCKSLPEDK